MNSEPRRLWCVCALQAASLLSGGCSGDKPEQPRQAHALSVAPEPRDAAGAPAPPQSAAAREPAPAPEAPGEAAKALVWDAVQQRRVVDEGAEPLLFRFRMTNVSRQAVVIEKVSASCGCTTFDTRKMPFSLAPGDSEDIQIRMSVTGKWGTITKSLLVHGSQAAWTLLVTAEIVPPAGETAGGLPSGAAMSPGARARNIKLAQADRQAVFQGDCAGCHARFAEGQTGFGLYLGACAICHDANPRASMVPDLRASDEPRDADYWRQHIADGLEGTLMPAFAKAKGGILSDEQIESLVQSLVEKPLKPRTAKQGTAP